MQTRNRAFIRHPVEIPIEVAVRSAPRQRKTVQNLSFGGLAFGADQSYAPGTLLGIRIGIAPQPVQLSARVAWCERRQDQYEVGVAFEDRLDAYRIRMVEQACQIERYRREVRACEGRTLTVDEAALEWIERHADRFDPQY